MKTSYELALELIEAQERRMEAEAALATARRQEREAKDWFTSAMHRERAEWDSSYLLVNDGTFKWVIEIDEEDLAPVRIERLDELHQTARQSDDFKALCKRIVGEE